jgi:hypothetical protein
MGKTTSRNVKPPTLENLIDLFNERKISAEELTEKAIPLLVRQRQNRIFHFMGQLASDSPERYHIGSPHHASLWTDAEAAYDAKIVANLAAKPSVRRTAEETIRRVEAEFNQTEDQPASV